MSLIFLLLMLTAPTPAPSPTAAIRGVLDAQATAWNRGDIDAYMQGYWHAQGTEFVGAGGVTRGWEATRTRYRQHYPDRAAMGRLGFDQLEIHVLCADAALVTGRYQLDRASDHPHGYFTLVFHRFPEGWRIISDHTTAAQPL